MHKLNYNDCITLLHLIDRGTMTFNMCIEWAFKQYTDDGIDPKIEAIALAYDLDDLVKIVRDFAMHRKGTDRHSISFEFLLGETYAFSINKDLDHHCVSLIQEIVEQYGEDLPLPDSIRKLIFDSIDYHNIYGFHETPKYDHLNDAEYEHMNKQFQKVLVHCKNYHQTYLDTVKIFGIHKSV